MTKSPPDELKLRGGYYTPGRIAKFLSEWAADALPKVSSLKALEPSAGDGAFVSALAQVLPESRITAVELSHVEAHKIQSMQLANVEVVSKDVFSWYDTKVDRTFDLVVGNPPFIRYQSFPEMHRDAGFRLMREVGLNPNRLTNAWVPFVVLAARALKPGGQLAMVLPAELLQVSYAGELRAFLARNFSQINVVTFRQLVFQGIQQETVLLMATRASPDAKQGAEMRFLQLDDQSELQRRIVEQHERVPADLDHAREKWIQYYLSKRELGLIRELEQSDTLTTLGQLAHIDVGVVTGRNEFFVLKPSEALDRGIRDSCLPMVGRSSQVPGLQLTLEDWRGLESADAKCLLMQLGKAPRNELSTAARRYVEWGESRAFDAGYKCKIRLPEWWFVPSTAVPDAFLVRQIHDGPRIINNLAKATCTDTIHRVRVRPGVDSEYLAASSMNSVTFAFSEIRGRSYGGGVLELEPTEAEGLPFPFPRGNANLRDLDLWARRKTTTQVLDEVDRLFLADCGITSQEALAIRDIWERLSLRRRQRRRAG